MKDIKVDGKTQRVFILLENDERIVYIPVKSLHRVDYEVLKAASANANGGHLIDVLKKTKLANGRNALVQFENIIQVVVKENGKRLPKPDERKEEPQVVIVRNQEDIKDVPAVAPEVVESARKKPGPKPKAK